MSYRINYYTQKHYTHTAVLDESFPESQMIDREAIPSPPPKIHIEPFNKSAVTYGHYDVSDFTAFWYKWVYGPKWKQRILDRIRTKERF